MAPLRESKHSYQPIINLSTPERQEYSAEQLANSKCANITNILLDNFARRKFLSMFLLIFSILVLYLILCVKVENNELIFQPAFTGTIKFNKAMTCRLPKLDPFDMSIRHLITEPDYVKCTDNFPLLFSSTLNSTLVTVKNIEEEFDNVLSCCYQALLRGFHSTDPDNTYGLSNKCYPLFLKKGSAQVIPPEHEFIVISCKFSNSDNGNISSENYNPNSNSAKDNKDNVYWEVMDMHAFTHVKHNIEIQVEKYYKKYSIIGNNRKRQHMRNQSKSGSDKVNVVILGIDGVSRMNFIRTMPASYSYLKTGLSAVEMEGFNKIGDNTFPNLVAGLTSLNQSTIESTCEDDTAFDGCPFIWKRYAGNGYRTSFGEDSTWMGIFNYLKIGFQTPPTDYYLRPFGVAAEGLIGNWKTSNAKLCYGPRLTFEVLLDYMRKMAFTMGFDKRYFQFIWSTSLTHDRLNNGGLGDRELLSTLKWFNREGYLNHTIFILMSDHGIRWGEIHNFSQGQIEERLPFLYYVVPNWFQQKYKRAYENLKLNQDRLTTPFDFHETLVDLLDLYSLEESSITDKGKKQEVLHKHNRLPRGISQFLPIPLSRTCEEAEIAEHYCTCHQLKEIDVGDPEVEKAAHFIVSRINKLVSTYPKCATLRLINIKIAHSIVKGVSAGDPLWNLRKSYELTVETSPGNALFEASVIKSESGIWSLSGTVSRTNLYGNQSHCVDEPELKLYCYCTDLIT